MTWGLLAAVGAGLLLVVSGYLWCTDRQRDRRVSRAWLKEQDAEKSQQAEEEDRRRAEEEGRRHEQLDEYYRSRARATEKEARRPRRPPDRRDD